MTAAVVIAILVFIPLSAGGPVGGFTTLLGAVIGVFFLAHALLFPTMRYELDPTTLHLRYGPLIHYRVPLEGIQAMRRKNLSVSLWSSMRFPGIAFGWVPYNDEGMVRMVATRASTDILLLDTTQGKFGITPEDEAGLVQAITEQKQG